MEEPFHSPATGSELTSAEALKKLRMLVHASAISILILAGTLFIFLYRQAVTIQKNTRDLTNYVLEFQNSSADEFIKEAHRSLAQFREQHPDFSPIYLRYFGTNPPPSDLDPAQSATNDSKVVPAPPR